MKTIFPLKAHSATALAAQPVEVLPPAAPAAVQVLTSRQVRASGYSEPAYLGAQMDVQFIQNALRAAERGDFWMLAAIYRDMQMGYTHLQAEWSKRKCVIIGQPMSIVPYDKDDPDDKIACEVIADIIENCRNWRDGLTHLMDATLYPLAAAEKIYQPVSSSETSRFKHPLRYTLKEIAPIPYQVLCFKIPYLGYAATAFNPDDWEAWLRFYSTSETGMVDFTAANAYAPSRKDHIIHRGNLLSPSIPPNYGGHMRAILFWWLLATKDRDWWALMMQKYGMPMMVAKADAQQLDTVNFLQGAFALATQIGGLVIDKNSEVVMEQMNGTDGSNSHKIFSDYCNCEVSKLVVGQVLSSTPKSTGLGSGMAEQAEGVRDDIRVFDTSALSDTLRRQLFQQALEINGYRGRAPHIYWGGKKDGDASMLSKTLAQLGQGGYELTDAGIGAVSDRLGYGIQRREVPLPVGGDGQPKEEGDGEDKTKEDGDA